MPLEALLRDLIDHVDPPSSDEQAGKKNYTERMSHRISDLVAGEIRDMGLTETRAPGSGHDRQFMGGYGTKGVDVYLSDEKHGLLLTSGVKGLLYDPRKNLKNRYRDMAMEALELHKRFPYAICGHFFFMGRDEVMRPSRRFGTVLGEAVALLSLISGRNRPDEVPEIYETIGIALFNPGDPDSLETASRDIPENLHAANYCERLVRAFHARNPFYGT